MNYNAILMVLPYGWGEAPLAVCPFPRMAPSDEFSFLRKMTEGVKTLGIPAFYDVCAQAVTDRRYFPQRTFVVIIRINRC
ncbi:MAG: hypothetical protein GX684_04120 [Ruminococcaceae bacterium]|nr:hypothetical protein [Oscillospiraceae bacterium]